MIGVPPTARFLDKPAVLILLGALILMVPALLNGFPFVFPDTIDYLTLEPQVFRLPFYGLLITFFHWNQFIWAPVIMQCAVVSHLIWLLVRLTSGVPQSRHFLLFLLILVAFTSLPFFTGFLMADIFTPIMFLAYYLLCFHHRALSVRLRYYLFLLACIATVTHITNLTLAFGLFLVLVILLAVAHAGRGERLRSITLISGPILLGLTAVITFNGLFFQQWNLAPAGQDFFLANLIEYGPARDYLDEACPTEKYRICAYRPYPPTANELMWIEKSVVWRLGGFMAMKPEANAIVQATLHTRPGAVARIMHDNFVAGLKTHAPAMELYPNFIIPPFRTLVGEKFGATDLHALNTSAQSRGSIPHTAIEAVDAIVAPASFLLLVLMVVTQARSRSEWFRLGIATLCFVLGNVALCTAISGVHDRYQSRITWLMPLVLGLYFMAYIKKRRA